MKKAALSLLLTFSMLICLIPTVSVSAEKRPQYHSEDRQMEKLNRGLIAVKTSAAPSNGISEGVYLSWRLLGDESLEDQAFDIYRNDAKIYTTSSHAATCYTDQWGSVNDVYKVVKKGESPKTETGTPVWKEAAKYARGSLVGNGTSRPNAFSYMDIPIVRPNDVKNHGGGTSKYYSGNAGANDASVGDLDGDGDYEIVLKWDPSDSKDAASGGYTGNVYIDGYEINENNGGYMWRIDLGKNIRAGAHTTQFMVYDFDGDGKSEIAMKTAPGSIDGTGHYVTEVGDTDEIRNADNNAVYLSGKGIPTSGGEYVTIFDGETGRALYTREGITRDAVSDWGDSKWNRSERYLAAVAYIDGKTPHYIECRGYYNAAVVRAYKWDGDKLTLVWEHKGNENRSSHLYGQGNHNLSVADVDNDGMDEIVYGSAVLDHNGSVIGNTRLGHGDAMHVSDFNNDGIQEVFSVKEKQVSTNAMDFRVAATGQNIFGKGAGGDTGRGLMVNADDAYAKAHPNALALGWSSSHADAYDLTGTPINAKPATNSRIMTNFAVYWDGDLGRELLDDNQLAKYYADTGWTIRFYNDGNGYLPASSNNDSKQTPSLSVDLWGDWREEIIMPIGKGEGETPYLRIFTSLIPTDYRLTTLMHDCQYRLAIAWQNVAYNQPPHTSYYIGSAALATDASGNELNYLAPAVPFTRVSYAVGSPVEGVELSPKSVTLNEGQRHTLTAQIYPADAAKKSISWSSDNESVATVNGGTVTAVSAGKCTITATTKDGGFTDTCEVTVRPTKTVDCLDYAAFMCTNTDAETEFNGGRDFASIYQKNAMCGGEMYRDFRALNSGCAELSFAFNSGGRKDANDAWNWDGREYTFGIDFLDTCGNNILNLSQSYLSSAQKTMAKIGTGEPSAIDSSWTSSGSGTQNPLNRSSTTWYVTLVFNYDEDICSASIMGSERDLEYTKTFPLGGKSFMRLRYYTTIDLGGTVEVSPSISSVKYSAKLPVTDPEIVFGGGEENTVTFSILGAEERNAAVIGVLQGENATEIKCADIAISPTPKSEALTFDASLGEGFVKLFLWDSLETLTPLGKGYSSKKRIRKLDISSATASAEPEPANGAANVIDGDLSTCWASQGVNDVILDLGKEYELSGVNVAFKKYDDARTIPFEIYASTDNTAWNELYRGSSLPQSGDLIRTYVPDGNKARYVKIVVMGNNISGWSSVAEAEVYGSEPVVQALKKLPVKSFSATSEPEPANSAANVFDGDLSTCWASLNTNSITMDLGESRELSAVNVAFKKYDDERIIPFEVYISSDNSYWEEIYSGNSFPFAGGFMSLHLPSGKTARYVKVTVEGNTISKWTSLAEIELYGKDTQ